MDEKERELKDAIDRLEREKQDKYNSIDILAISIESINDEIANVKTERQSIRNAKEIYKGV